MLPRETLLFAPAGSDLQEASIEGDALQAGVRNPSSAIPGRAMPACLTQVTLKLLGAVPTGLEEEITLR